MNKREKAKILLHLLSSHRFERWYNRGNFNKWVVADNNAPTTEQILIEIENIFDLKDS